MSAYVHWIKPRLLSASAPKGGKSLLLHLCARSRFLIPMIVFTAFWIFDAQMQIEATVSLTLSRNVRITIGHEGAQPDAIGADDDNDDDDDDDDEPDDDVTYTVDSYSDGSLPSEDDSLFELEDVENALREFVETQGSGWRFLGWVKSYLGTRDVENSVSRMIRLLSRVILIIFIHYIRQ